MQKRVKWALAIIATIVLAVAIVYVYFNLRECKDRECFNAKLVSCSQYRYVDNAEEAVWLYKIQGKSETNTNSCIVDVKLVQIKNGNVAISGGEGKNMVCSLPLGVVVSPPSDIGKCSGQLREFMQSLIIDKLHQYILSNLGQIDQSLNNAF